MDSSCFPPKATKPRVLTWVCKSIKNVIFWRSNTAVQHDLLFPSSSGQVLALPLWLLLPFRMCWFRICCTPPADSINTTGESVISVWNPKQPPWINTGRSGRWCKRRRSPWSPERRCRINCKHAGEMKPRAQNSRLLLVYRLQFVLMSCPTQDATDSGESKSLLHSK